MGCAAPAQEEGRVSPGSAAAPAEEQADDGTATWGERYTWPDGLAVEVSEPVACKPGEMAMPQGIKRAVKVTVTVINGTEEEFNAGALSIGTEAQFDGAAAEDVFDSGGGCGPGLDMGGTVLPGKTFRTEMAFSVGKNPGELQLVLQPTFNADKAIYVGKA